MPVLITALDPQIEAPFSLQASSISQGRFLHTDDRDAVVIGAAMAERLQVNVGDRVNLLGRRQNESMRQHSMTVVGIYSLGLPEIEKSTVYMSLSDAQVLYNLRDQVTSAVVFLDSVGSENQLMSEFQVRLPAYEIDTWQTLRPEIRETLDTKLAFTSFIGLVVLLIASIGILNLMLMAAFERTREMGVLSALGMKGRQIMSLFLVEGALIGLVGAVIGCGLGVLLVGTLSQVGISLEGVSGMGEIGALLGDRIYP
ncbi:MAG: ABC transporter permease, partial [Chloroflexia bacterium]|nr:ABC transporter permease [Chloroflexia bacterium]